MRILFLRHGQDDDTRRGGWSEYGLLDEGRRQAQQVASYLQNSPQYAIRRILASDLPRTMQTAAYVSEALNLPIQQEPRLREINNGALAGMPNTEALERYPGMFFQTLEMEEPYPGEKVRHSSMLGFGAGLRIFWQIPPFLRGICW